MTSFTVAIPTHDRRETVLLAVRSVLRQTCPPQQLVVTCDGCTDGTAEALRDLGDPRVEVVELAKGDGYAYGHRNVALERATGDVITWIGDDDLLLPDHLERLAERWSTGDLDVLTTPAAIVDPDDGLRWIGRDWSVPSFRELLRRENTNVMASVSARTALLREVGGWDDRVPRAGDWDLWRRAVDAGPRVAMLHEPTVLHFRASGRTQAWADRVRQNAEWLERIGDPAALPDLRRRLRHSRGVSEAAVLDERAEQIASLRAHAGRLEEHAAEAQAYAASLEADRAERERDGAALRARIAELEDERRSDGGRLAELEAEVDRQRAVLRATYSGGWWRLRGVVLAVVVRLRAGRRWRRGR